MSGSHPITLSAAQTRRLLLHRQGLLLDGSTARRTTKANLARLIEQMGYVQIDSINVVDRAHHLTLHSRLAGFSHDLLKRLVERDRRFFEHWTHDASIIPIDFFANWHHRRRRMVENPRVEQWVFRKIAQDSTDDPAKVFRSILSRIEREGPLQSRDFNPPQSGRKGSSAWWGWKPTKAALEYLWWRGDLSIAHRVNFQKVYDLTSRVYPDHHDLDPPHENEFLDWACRAAIKRCGVATVKQIAEFFGALRPEEARQWCRAQVASGELIPVTIEPESTGGARSGQYFAQKDIVRRVRQAERAFEKSDRNVLRLLSPFDPVLRDRRRAEEFFGFSYRFEGFVPEIKRQYGYYVMPILEGDRLIGRLDPKFHRDRGELVIRRVWWEPKVRPTKKRQAELERAVDRLADMIGADNWRIGRR